MTICAQNDSNMHAIFHMHVVINFDALAQEAIFESKGDKLSSSAECCIRTRVSETESPADWMPVDKPTELSSIELKTLTQ